MEQLTIIAGATPAQQEAAAMHFEIVEAAKSAVNSLLDLGRKLKRMRDSGRFKDLGFETFGSYTEAAVGIKQRQAYSYIQVVETLPARLIEENATSGITKLALLCKLSPADREEVAGEGLAEITVAELQKLIEEKNGLAEQLSMLESGSAAPAAEAHAEEVDLDAIRAEAAAQAREEEQRRHEEALAKAKREQEEAVAAARREAEAEAIKNVPEATEKAQEQARKTAVQQIAEEREKAASQARAQRRQRTGLRWRRPAAGRPRPCSGQRKRQSSCSWQPTKTAPVSPFFSMTCRPRQRPWWSWRRLCGHRARWNRPRSSWAL